MAKPLVSGSILRPFSSKKSCSRALLRYHYFNVDSTEPCRPHADPGLLTVLCRSTEAALQARRPLRPGGAPGVPAAYEETWCDLEPMMDRLSEGAEEGSKSRLLMGFSAISSDFK